MGDLRARYLCPSRLSLPHGRPESPSPKLELPAPPLLSYLYSVRVATSLQTDQLLIALDRVYYSANPGPQEPVGRSHSAGVPGVTSEPFWRLRSIQKRLGENPRTGKPRAGFPENWVSLTRSQEVSIFSNHRVSMCSKSLNGM